MSTLYDEHDYIELTYFAYLILYVSAVQNSHHQVRHEYTVRVNGRGLVLSITSKKLLQIIINNYYSHNNNYHNYVIGARSGAVVEALRYKPEGRGIDSRWCHWNFSLT
jgi:hypothetical protein